MIAEEKYGENFRMTDSQIEEEQRRIDMQECREATEKCIKKIKELIKEEEFNKQEVIDEVEELIGYLEEI